LDIEEKLEEEAGVVGRGLEGLKERW